VTDFFPHHHRQIGVMPGGAIFRLALAVETWLMRRCAVIGCMSVANLAYLRSHYDLGAKPRTEVLGLWGPTDRPDPADRSAVRSAHGLPVDRPVVIYGGQLTAGRGFDEVLEAARLSAQRGLDPFFLIIGQGSLERELAQAAATGGNIAVKPRIPREDYLTLLAACDVGIVCTVPGVDVPSFPSKTIDLLRAGVPIAASVERTTDYADFIRDNGLGVTVEAGSAERLLGAITAIIEQPEPARRAMAVAARETLDRVFDVRKVSRRLIAQSFPGEAA
jgi:glycosyltransferase involved in cell wall biosynthesis